MSHVIRADRPDGVRIPFDLDSAFEFEIKNDVYYIASLCFKPEADPCVYRVQQVAYDAEDKDCCRPMLWERWCRIVTKEEAREICREAGKPIPSELEDRPEMKRAEPRRGPGPTLCRWGSS
jgi:hypothetical protein